MATLVIQPTSQDTFIDANAPTTNTGTAITFSTIPITFPSTARKALLLFDLSGVSPTWTIQSVTLRLWLTSSTPGATNQNIGVHRGLAPWVETEATWQRSETGVPWAGGDGGAGGTDYVSAATNTIVVGAASANYDWDVTSDVVGIVAGTYTNYGWWLISTNEADRKDFRSLDHSTPSTRPQLIIEYDPNDEMSGSFSAGASFSGEMPVQEVSGSFAGQSTISGAVVGWGLLSGTFDGQAAFSGEMPVQEMSGSFAGESSFTGGGRAVLLPRVPIWTAIVGATTYAISGGNPFYRLQATGLGIPNVRNIKQRGPFQDGSTRRDFRLDERFLNLMFLLRGATRAQADTYRDTLLEIFKPLTDTPVQIRVTRDDGVIKQIDTYAVGVLDIPETESERFAATQRVLVQLEAPNPIWYGPTLQNLGFASVVGGAEGFAVPMTIPWAQQPGEYINVTESFYYEGNWKEYPVIVITGPATDAKITNLTTNEKIDFTGYSIAAGDTRTIDLRFGTKTVKNAASVLKNSELTTDSDLGTFHLAPNPEATGGINDIKVEILSGATTATRVSIQFYNRYTHL